MLTQPQVLAVICECGVHSVQVYTLLHCVHCTTVHWDTAIDAEEYNRISSIVENSIDEENNVDGGFSNLETQKTVITCIMTQ